MFYLRSYRSLCYSIVCACLFVAQTCSASSEYNASINETQLCELFFQHVDNSNSIEEISRFLISARESFFADGYNIPDFSEILNEVYDYLENKGVLVDLYIANQVNVLLTGHCALQSSLSLLHIAKKSANDRVYFGLLKCVAGTLLLIIPHPATVAAGSVILGNGVQDLTQSSIQKSQENLRRQEQEGKPKPPPHFSPDYFDKQR